MYSEGNIIYFDPFYFKNGGQAKPKYFLVLNCSENSTILASLPSSIAHLPADIPHLHGCINKADCGISCYIIQKGEPVTTDDWSFPENTFLYGNWIDEFDLSILKETYQLEGIEYQIIGCLKTDEFSNIKDCFRNSSIVKRKFKRML